MLEHKTRKWGWMDGWMAMDGWMDGWINGWINGLMDGWMDGWMAMSWFCHNHATVFPLWPVF